MDKKLSALIVDDEEMALDLLYRLLEDTHQFADIRTANSAAVAREQLLHHQPDLLFLDVKMPDLDGFAFLEELKKENRHVDVIFVTAYDQFALKALKNHAFDYLLKPVDRKELLDCIMQFKSRKQDTDLLDRLEKVIHGQKENKLRINTRTGYIFLDPAQILYCQADGNYTFIDMGDRQHLCSLQLGLMEESLPKNGFLRLGRSLIVNFNFIIKVDRKTNQVTFEKSNKLFNLSITKAQLKELESSRVYEK